jgi:hypothetical protein
MKRLVALSSLIAVTLCAALPPVVAAQGTAPEPGYLDDRSTPEAVISSYYDAINRKEYARAYSYWEFQAAQTEIPDFDAFQQGFADIASVQLTTGYVASDVAAGQLYFSVPITLVAAMSDDSTQTFTGCFTLHLAQPSFQAAPPYRPMGIRTADIQQVENDADTAMLMAASCPPL